jgi:hemolysin activation/secretion protein
MHCTISHQILTRKSRQLILLGVLLPWAAPALALEPGDHLNVRDTHSPRPEFRSASSIPAFELPAIKAPEPGARDESQVPASTSRILQRVVFEGNLALPTDQLETLAAPWIGRPANVADLEMLRVTVTRLYIQRGYVNSGALLESRTVADDGTVKLRLIEGRLSELRLQGLDGLDEEYVRSKLLPEPDAPLNIEFLRERFQLLLDDPLFERLNARLVPGSRLGEAMVELDAKRSRPYQVKLHLNNYRSPSIGELGLGIGGWIRNLTGRGDLLKGSLQPAAQEPKAYRASMGWSIPIHFAGTTAQIRVDKGESSVIEEPLQAAGITSDLSSIEVGLSHKLFENLRQRLVIGANRTWRVNQSWLGGQPFSFVAGEADGRVTVGTYRFWQEYSYRSDQQVIALRSTFSASRNNLDLTPVLQDNSHAASSYQNWLGQVQYIRRLNDDGMQLTARVTRQHATTRMLAMDGLSIGGLHTVRGFRENQLIRDRGHVVNLELEIPVSPTTSALTPTRVVPFIDHGSGHNIGQETSKITAAGIGLRWRWGDYEANLSLARRVSRSANVTVGRDSLQDSGIQFQISYNFFGS